jgi:hypothetical protein
MVMKVCVSDLGLCTVAGIPISAAETSSSTSRRLLCYSTHFSYQLQTIITSAVSCRHSHECNQI